jgi:hypothetical protein
MASTSTTTAARRAKHPNSCQSRPAKIFMFPKYGNYDLTNAPRPDTRDVRPSSRHVGRDAMDAEAGRRCTPRRTVKSCGPDPPTLGSSSWTISRATEANKPALRGEREAAVTHCAGSAGSFRLYLTCLCAFFCSCTQGCGCGQRPAFPAPSIFGGAPFLQSPDAKSRRGNAVARHCERSEAIQTISAAAVWIASSASLLAMTNLKRDVPFHGA